MRTVRTVILSLSPGEADGRVEIPVRGERKLARWRPRCRDRFAHTTAPIQQHGIRVTIGDPDGPGAHPVRPPMGPCSPIERDRWN
jgi:hypothetical protein